MTDQKQVDPTKAGTLAQKIVTILIDEDSETRQRAIQAAMTLLGEDPIVNASFQLPPAQGGSGGDSYVDLAAFFNRNESLKLSDYAYLCAAYHFKLYGTAAFSLDELRSIATEAGVVLPDRLDMTLRQAGKGGKKLFQFAGRDAYKPTAAAGVFFKDRWDVKPGKGMKDAAKNAQT